MQGFSEPFRRAGHHLCACGVSWRARARALRGQQTAIRPELQWVPRPPVLVYGRFGAPESTSRRGRRRLRRRDGSL